MSEFLVVGDQSISVAHVSRVEWDEDPANVSGQMKINAGAYLLLVPFDSPDAKAVAERFGFAKRLEGWPKRRDAAQGKVNARNEQNKLAKAR